MSNGRPAPITLKVAAQELGLQPASLRQAIARGTLRAHKLGRDWTVTQAEVERYRRGSLGQHGRGT